ncbi:MAG: energy transducer TonB [Bacteroidales bacterium]|jgi:protein TonB
MPAPDFDDIIFERLNKEYGAYFLRKKYNRVVSAAIVAACILGSAVVLIPYFIIPAEKNKEIYSSVYVTMENLKPPEEPAGLPQLPAPPAPQQTVPAARIAASVAKYVAPKVVDSLLSVEKPVDLTVDSVPGTLTGQETINGSGKGTGNLSEPGGGGGGNGTGGNGLFSVVEEMPKFKGGDINRFREWVQKKTKYPDIATINGIQGKVYVTFIVEKDGSVTNVKVIKGVDPLINDEALKAVASSPKWSPGRQRGVAVRVSYLIMLNFQL